MIFAPPVMAMVAMVMVTGLTTLRWNIMATGKKINPIRCNIRLRVRRWHAGM